jgi:hypothetical protein
MRIALLFSLIFLGVAQGKVGIDDDYYYVDESFSCPIQTDPTQVTCDQVCVASQADCPSLLQCDAGTLCPDGTCETSCSDDFAVNPCEPYGALSTACYMGGLQTTAANCTALFQVEYDNMDVADGEDDSGDDYYGEKLAPEYPAFVFFYVWMGFMTVAPLLYFAYNNRFNPIGDVLPFVPESKFYFKSV